MAFQFNKHLVAKRFQIEDLVNQDASGVVFRALETETGKTVAVRRFFPFGADGGGLEEDEQVAYNIAISRLAGLSHPALRSVICGGCDPIDGMPFIATEWIEGVSLQRIIDQGPLSAELATELITQLLEVCELLSRVLAEEAVWVETVVERIVVGGEQSGRRFTFWISPLKWLGTGEEPRGLESIITLTEEIMGWKGQPVTDQAGRGLGGWLKWLRGAAAKATLHEAHEKLSAFMTKESPPRARISAAKASRPQGGVKKRSTSKALLLANVGLGLTVAGLGGWLYHRQNGNSFIWSKPLAGAVIETPAFVSEEDEPPEAPAAKTSEDFIKVGSPERESRDAAGMSRRAMELSEQAQRADREKEAILKEQQSAAGKNGGVIQWNHRELLIDNASKEVVVEGVLESIGVSKTGATLYLCFSKEPGKNDARGAVASKTASADLSKEALTPLIGKKIRLHGTVKVEKRSGWERPEIRIKDRASIEVVP